MDRLKVAQMAKSYSTGVVLVASGGNYSHIQLWNPAASGKILVAREIHVTGEINVNMLMGYNAAALTNLSALVANRFCGGASGVGQIRTQHNNSALLSGATRLGNFRIFNSTGCDFQVPMDSPIVIPEGTGLVVVPDTLGTFCALNILWDES